MKFLTILLCKILSFIGKMIGRGSSLPGAIALKINPHILSQLKLPENVVAVTGSNGKTSTVEMIAAILTAAGKKVVYNKEGSNQIEGITTLLLNNANFSGRVKGDVVLLESDERYARHSFKHIKPTLFVITNLYRDQLTRNAHPYHIFNILQDAVDLLPNAALLLNADDPIIRNFGYGRANVLYFGMDQNVYSTETTDALYNDCYYCPHCKKELHYDFFHYAHLGQYTCPHCGYDRPSTAFSVSDMDLEKGHIRIGDDTIQLAFASRYNVYNLCAAYATASLLGVSGELIAGCLSDFVMKNGRNVRFLAGENEGFLITSKHENSTSYNQSLEYVSRQKEKSTLVILVDAISRKYYTAETSWLWDISFEMLNHSAVDTIYLTGKYAYDLALRFELADIKTARIIVEPDLDKMAEAIKQPSVNKLFAITCFSDKEKLFDRVTLLN